MECRGTFPGNTLWMCSSSPGIWGFLISKNFCDLFSGLGYVLTHMAVAMGTSKK